MAVVVLVKDSDVLFLSKLDYSSYLVRSRHQNGSRWDRVGASGEKKKNHLHTFEHELSIFPILLPLPSR